MKILRIIICLIFTAIFISCSVTKDMIEIGELSNLNISGIKNNEILFNGQLEITNRSNLPFKINTIELEVIANNTKIGIVKSVNPLRISGHCSKEYSINFAFEITNPDTEVNIIFDYINGIHNEFRLKGIIQAKYFLFKKDVEIDKQIDIVY